MRTELGRRRHASSHGAFRAATASYRARLIVPPEPACTYHKSSDTAVKTSLLLRNGRPRVSASTMRAKHPQVWQRTDRYCRETDES